MKLRPNKKTCVTLGSGMSIVNLTPNEIIKIKEALTYTNPEYVNAKRFSGYSNIRIPKYLTYYESIPHGLRVPVGFDYSRYCKGGLRDFRTVATCDTPNFLLTLRDDQRRAVDAYIKKNTMYGAVNGMVQMPTGKGKSIVGLYLAARLKQRTLVIVHKTDLVRGWMKDAQLSFGDDFKCGQFGGGKKILGDFITIATVQTLNQLGEEELDSLFDYFGMVIADECHHTPARTYSLISKFSARYKLGLTATPERKDGLRDIMFNYFGDFCFKSTSDTDILSVNVVVKRPPVYLDPLCKVHKRQSGGKYYTIKDMTAPATYEPLEDEIRLSDVPYKDKPKILYSDIEDYTVKCKSYVKAVISDMTREINLGKSCVAFFRLKEHCAYYYDMLLRAGVPENLIQIYNGDCSNKELEQCLQRAERKQALMTLTTYAKSTEGTNVRSWEVGFLVGSVNDGKMAEQAVGRIRRISPNKAKVATLYDYHLQNVVLLSKHFFTRMQRYQKLGFNIVQNSQKVRSLFGRGYN